LFADLCFFVTTTLVHENFSFGSFSIFQKMGRKQGRKPGKPNWKMDDLLNAVKEILPVTTKQWEQTIQYYGILSGDDSDRAV
jgi:hypothetical protein